MSEQTSKADSVPIPDDETARREYWRGQSFEAKFAESWRLTVERFLAEGGDPADLTFKKQIARKAHISRKNEVD